MKNIASMICVFLLGLFSISSNAVPIPIGPVVTIGGGTFSCVDPLGHQVMNYSAPTNQIAVATMLNGASAIVLDLNVLGNTAWQFELIAYAHECGHHFLGHVLNPSYTPNPGHELAADCWAAKTTRDYGWLSPADYSVAMSVLYTFPGDVVHPSGSVRVQNSNACYNTVP